MGDTKHLCPLPLPSFYPVLEPVLLPEAEVSHSGTVAPDAKYLGYPDQVEWLMQNNRQRYKLLYYRFKRWAKRYPQHLIDANDIETATRLSRAECGNKLDKDLCDRWLDDTSAPTWVRDWCTVMWNPKDSHADHKWLSSKTVLLTWNGSWGDLAVPPPAFSAAVDLLSSIPDSVADLVSSSTVCSSAIIRDQ